MSLVNYSKLLTTRAVNEQSYIKYSGLKYNLVCTASTHQVCNCRCKKTLTFKLYYSYGEKLNLINKMSLFRNCYFMKQVAINRSCCQCLLYSVIHKFRNKAERMFSDSSVFPAKFLDISRFWCHPEVSHFRKIKLGNSSLMCPLCSMTMIGQNIVTNWQSYNKIITSEMDMGWVQPWVGCVEKSVLIFYIFR